MQPPLAYVKGLERIVKDEVLGEVNVVTNFSENPLRDSAHFNICVVALPGNPVQSVTMNGISYHFYACYTYSECGLLEQPPKPIWHPFLDVCKVNGTPCSSRPRKRIAQAADRIAASIAENRKIRRQTEETHFFDQMADERKAIARHQERLNRLLADYDTWKEQTA